MTPSTIFSARSTSPPKSLWPGVSTMLILVAVVDRGVLGQDGDAALALQLVRVHDPLRDLLVGAEGAAWRSMASTGGLAVVDVGDDGDVADFHELLGTHHKTQRAQDEPREPSF
jgi:hypothetical protein